MQDDAFVAENVEANPLSGFFLKIFQGGFRITARIAGRFSLLLWSMGDDEQPKQPDPFPRAELWFYVIGTVVAAPLAKSGWDALMAGDKLRGALSLTAAAVAAVGGFSFKYWESHLATPTRAVIREFISNRMVVGAVLLIFLAYGFVVLPDLSKDRPAAATTSEQAFKSRIADLENQLRQQTEGTPSDKASWQPARLGRMSWMNFYNTLREPPDEIRQAPNKIRILINQPSANAVSGMDLGSLFFSFPRSNLWPLNEPNYDHDLDAPKLRAGGGPAGITIHGRNPAADFLERALEHCYIIRRTSEMPAGFPSSITACIRRLSANPTRSFGWSWETDHRFALAHARTCPATEAAMAFAAARGRPVCPFIVGVAEKPSRGRALYAPPRLKEAAN